MATFASDYVDPTVSKIRSGGGVVGALPPVAPPVSTPSVSAPAGLGQQSYLAAAIKPKAAPAPVQQPTAPAAPTYDFSRDAELGTQATNLARQVASMGQQAVANSGFTTSPAGTGYSPSTMPNYGPNRDANGNPIIKTNEERLAGYTPEVVQGMYGGNEYAVTSAGLEAPDRAKFASNEDYLKAADTYNKLVLMEQDTEANSMARQFADARNADQAAVDEMRRRVAAADAAQKEVRERNAKERIALATRLAARGLDPNTDTWAGQKVDEADRLDREEQQAAASIASIDASTLRSQAGDAARKALVDRIASITAAKNKLVEATAKENKIQNDLLLAQAKDENYQSQVDYRKSEAERKAAETDLKEARNPALIALDEARAKKLITDAEYTAGVKSLNTEADTALKKANTEKITTLLPEQLAKLRAETAKLRRVGTGSGGGGAAGITDEEILGAQKLFQAQGGTGIASGKVLTSAINLYRAANGQPDNLVEEATEGKATYKKETSGSGSFRF
jgi:hypothetical protein